MPGVDGMRDAVRAPDVVRPDVGGEPVLGRVREPDRLGLVVERHRHEHGPEDLLLEDAHRLVDVGDHRRLEVVAVSRPGRARRRRRGRARPRRAPTRCSRARARSARRVISGPSSVRGSTGSPTRMLRARAATVGDDPLVERPLHEQPRAGRAALAVHGEDLRQRRVDARGRDRRPRRRRPGDLPPSSTDERLSVGAPAAITGCPVAASPVKQMRLTPGCARERRAGRLAEAVHDVEHARRQAGLLEHLGEQRRRTAATTRPA